MPWGLAPATPAAPGSGKAPLALLRASKKGEHPPWLASPQGVYEGGLVVVDMGDNGGVTNAIVARVIVALVLVHAGGAQSATAGTPPPSSASRLVVETTQS